MKSYTDLEQFKILVEILPLESADMEYLTLKENGALVSAVPFVKDDSEVEDSAYNAIYDRIPCWSLTALLRYLHKFKPQVYVPILFPTESKWILNFVEYGHGDVCKITCDNPVDTCVETILKLHELKLM